MNNYKKLICLFLALVVFSCDRYDLERSNPLDNNGETVTDIDGNVYKTVVIGSQVWMAENLKTTKYRDSTAIPNITDNATWAGLTTGAYCSNDNDTNNAATYGRLYNWYAVNDAKNMAPTGWHVASDAEWTILTTYLGGESVAGGKLKEAGTSHWASPNTDATNETGFKALPGGVRDYNGNFGTTGINGLYWSATENNATTAWHRNMNFNNANLDRPNNTKIYGFSVRCVKD